MSFEKNVFINCPFDDSCVPLLRPLLFTIIYLGLKPRIALEGMGAGKTVGNIPACEELLRRCGVLILNCASCAEN